MEDERRKFLQGLVALAGGAAMLPELVEAAQVKLERPISAKILKRETTKTDPFTDATVEIELTDKNGVSQTINVASTEYADTSVRRNWTTLVEGTNVVSMRTVAKKVDSSHEEVTVTVSTGGKTSTMTQTMPISRPPESTDGLSDEELVSKFLAPKLGAKP
jgi:hypothetical protein